VERSTYYAEMRRLAQSTRQRHDLVTQVMSLSRVRAVYRAEGIQIDYWRAKLRKVRAAYFLVDGQAYVLLNSDIKPQAPRLFALCHELKHHLVDQGVARERALGCGGDVSWQSGSALEIGAEVFAAEFIWPEREFLAVANEQGVSGGWRAEDVVRLKRASPAPVSYVFVQKRLRWFGLIGPEQFKGVQFQKLEEQLYGAPYYRGRWPAGTA